MSKCRFFINIVARHMNLLDVSRQSPVNEESFCTLPYPDAKCNFKIGWHLKFAIISYIPVLKLFINALKKSTQSIFQNTWIIYYSITGQSMNKIRSNFRPHVLWIFSVFRHARHLTYILQPKLPTVSFNGFSENIITKQ